MPLIDDIKWDEFEKVTSSTLSGFDARGFLVQKLQEWDPAYTYGLCGKEYLPEWQTENWQHLTVRQFGEKSLKSFNENTGLRFNLTVSEGDKLMWRKAYVMYMKTSYRQKLQTHRAESAERQHQQRLIDEGKKLERPSSTTEPGVERQLEEKQLPASQFQGS